MKLCAAAITENTENRSALRILASVYARETTDMNRDDTNKMLRHVSSAL